MSSDPNKSTRLAELLKEAWREYRDDIAVRIETVRRAGQLVRQQALTDEIRSHANAEAHKLAGVLGTFGLREASTAAVNLERMLSPGFDLDSQLDRFEEHIRTIHSAVAHKNSE